MASRVCWRTSARVGWLASLVAATTPLISPEATCWIDTFARLGLSLVAAGHYATEFPVCAAIADRLHAAFPELEVRVSGENRDPFTYI